MKIVLIQHITKLPNIFTNITEIMPRQNKRWKNEQQRRVILPFLHNNRNLIYLQLFDINTIHHISLLSVYKLFGPSSPKRCASVKTTTTNTTT